MTDTDIPRQTHGKPVEPLISHRYDWGETDPSTAVIETLAVARNCEPQNAEPLYDTIDPDALDELLSPVSGSSSPDLRVTFRYLAFLVTVTASGAVSVRPEDEGPTDGS